MRERKEPTKRGAACRIRASITLVLWSVVLLSACTSPQDQVRSGVVLEGEWQPISVGQADLNLPSKIHLAVSSLHRRSDTDLAVQDLYGFDGSEGIKGYIVAIRNPDSELPESTMLQMRQIRLFHSLVNSLPQARQYNLQIGPTYGRFTNGHPHSVGHYTIAPSMSGQEACFVALVGMLLVEDKGVQLSPGAIDTQIMAVLCGRQINEESWVAALKKSNLAARQILTSRPPT